MVDKLKIRIQNFKIRQSAIYQEFYQRTVNGEAGTVLVNQYTSAYLENGDKLQADKIVLNQDNFFATCYPAPVTGQGGIISGYLPVLIVEFNPAVVTKGHNIGNLTFSEFQQAIVNLERFLMKNFILQDDFKQAFLSRLDIGCDIQVNNEVAVYLDVLKHLPRTKRMKMRDYGTTVLYLNKQRQFTAYDKRESVEVKKQDYGKIKGNVLRLESRITKKRAQFYDSIENLLSDFQTVPDRIKDIFNDMTKKIDTDKVFYDLKDIFSYFTDVDKPSRYWFNDMLKNIGISFLLQRYNSETIIKVLKEMDADKSLISRVSAEFRGAEYKRKLTKKNLSGYLEELRDKVNKLAV